jgi:hypothetical protein
MTARPLLVVLAGLALGAGCAPKAAAQAIGPEFRVNTYTTDEQYRPAVASAADGRFVVAWHSFTQDASGWGVFGQRYDANGLPAGPEFRVNTYTTYDQFGPSVASAADGRFVVVWYSSGYLGQDGSGAGVFGQRYDSNGLPDGAEFRVNSHTTNHQGRPRVASAPDGRFVVVWYSVGQDGSLWGVFGQRYDTNGLPAGPEFRVNSYTTGYQTDLAVAAAADGRFVVTWDSFGQDGSGWGVFGQRYDANGLPAGPEFRVNSFTPNHQKYPAVAAAADGRFVVAWNSVYQDGSNWGVFAQRYDSNGLPEGPEFRVNSYATGLQYNSSVASTADGRFVTVWSSYYQDESANGVFGQRYDSIGLATGPEFPVNSYTTGTQSRPAVASAPDGRFVVAWYSFDQDGSANGVFARRFHIDVIFADGFQGG